MNFISHANENKKFLLLGDSILVFFAFFLAVFTKLTYFQSHNIKLVLPVFQWKVFIILLPSPILFFIFELYNQKYWKNNIKLILFITFTVLLTVGIVALYSYLFFIHNITIDKTTLLFYAIFSVSFLFFWRKCFAILFTKFEYLKEKILLIGNQTIMNDIERFMKNNNTTIPSNLMAIKDYSENQETIRTNSSVPSPNILELVIHKKYNTVVVPNNLEDFPVLRKQFFNIKHAGITLYDAPHFYMMLSGRVPIYSVDDSWFLFYNQGKKLNSFFYKKTKRIMDIFLSLFGITAALPLLFIIAIAIKVSSKGPVFFKQERLGLNNQPFTLIKFRTMIHDAEKITGPKRADKNDPRILKVGKLLRKTRLDELPQLFNVLKGEMSFVGTRPTRRHFAELLAKELPHYKLRSTVKPGITGWAQVRGGYFGTDEGQREKLEYDLFYIQNQSILFDIFIILKTISTVLSMKGE